MSVDYKCRQIYNDVIHEVTKSEEIWKSVLNLCGKIYRYEFDNVLMVYAQRPHSTLVADYDTWKKVDRYVKRGSKGVAIYPSRALDKHCRYVFDISDTGGRAVKLTWDFENGNLEGYAKLLSDRGDISISGNESRGELEKIIWDFTKSEQKLHTINQIAKEDMIYELGSLVSDVSCDILRNISRDIRNCN